MRSDSAIPEKIHGGIFSGQARLRGHIAQRIAICLRTPILTSVFNKDEEVFSFLMKFNEPMDGRFSSMRNCFAIPQSLEKSKEGFFQGRLREGYFFFAIEIELEKFKFLVKIGKKYAKFLIMCYNFLL